MKHNEDLDEYHFSSFAGFNGKLILWRYEVLQEYFHGKTCLELGSADGQGTDFLIQHFDRVVAVDGSEQSIIALKNRITSPKLLAVHSYFEELELGEKFDTIVLAHILEHVDDPQTIIAVAKRYLKPNGVIIIDVPNAYSLHRQIGVKMGLLDAPTQLNEADLSIGHKRVYTPKTFTAEVESAGLIVQKFGGVFIKVVSNTQTEQIFDDAQLKAFIEVGKDNPEIAAEIFVVATLA